MNSDERKIILKRIEDALKTNQNKPYFIGFFDDFTVSFLEEYLKKQKAGFMLFGGHQESERKMLAINASGKIPNEADFKNVITRISASYYKDRQLAHKDFLGALINGGIKRDAIGDIYIKENRAEIFLKSIVAEYIIKNISYIGGTAVKFNIEATDFEPPKREYTYIETTVKSLRLDGVVAHLIKTNREKAVSLIKCKQVILNYGETGNITKQVKNGDILAVRAYGKFIIDSTEEKTRQGRHKIRARKLK